MSANDETTDLISQHEAIRNHLRFVSDSIKSLATLAGRTSIQPTEPGNPVMSYLWRLYDLREGVKRHIRLDEKTFETAGAHPPDLSAEHDTVQDYLDEAIALAENVVYKRLSQNELNQAYSAIIASFNRISALIETHTAREDALFRRVPKV